MALNVDTTSYVAEWRKICTEGLFTPEQIKTYWKNLVRELYNNSSGKVKLEEGVDEKLLTNTLEEFICTGDPHNFLTQTSSSVCCKVFEMGEPTYSCTDCMMTSTSVLCVDCFKNSKHKDHNYKMIISISGECCDCGNVEVWKQDGLCNFHMATGKEKQHVLEDECKERVKCIFDSVVDFACEILLNCHNHLEQIEDLFNVYTVILYDNENYNFTNIVNILSLLVEVNEDRYIEIFQELKNEGRVIIHTASFLDCERIKNFLEYELPQNIKKDKVLVQHAYTTISQVVSMKLLTWLENFLRKSAVLRSVFVEIVLNSDSKTLSYFQKVITCGDKMWKSYRFLWHKVFVSGMMMEYKNKNILANEFAKYYSLNVHYALGCSNYSSVSFCSLSAHLFTVPSIAHHLIAKYNILHKLLEIIREFLIGAMTFRNPTMSELESKLDILKDLKYLLSTIPEQWNDTLKENFLCGIDSMLLILTEFHGFDSITIQERQHVQYERDFSIGLRIQLKLSSCISFLVAWCRNDKTILCKVYHRVLQKLREKCGTHYRDYDVSKDSVSFHLSLSRLLAALHLELGKYSLSFSAVTSLYPVPITPDEIIEPVLQCQVFFAQVTVGLWSTIGHCGKDAIRFYKSIWGRTEMLDRDVILLQIGASLMDSNEFLRCVFNTFLKNSAMQHLDTDAALMGKLLYFLLMIIGERHVPGVSNITNEDRIKNEIIQRLCIKSLSYWQFVEAIPSELLQNVDLNKLLKQLTNINKDSNDMHQYELKSEYFENYNMFFYHYTYEETSTSEKVQRLRRKTSTNTDFCPPPRLLQLSDSFKALVNLLQCNEMLKFLKTILSNCLNMKNRSDSEDNLQKVLYLIGYALHEEQSNYYPSFKFIEKSSQFEIFPLLKKISRHSGIDVHKGLLQWTIKKYTEVGKNTTHVTNVEKEEDVVLDSINEKERRRNLAMKKRKEIMEQMTTARNEFLKNNAKLYADTNDNNTIEKSPGSYDSLPEQIPVAHGSHKTNTPVSEKSYTCFICQEEEEVSPKSSTMVVPAFIQQSTILRQYTYKELFTDVTAELKVDSVPHINTCGHVLHSACYYRNVLQPWDRIYFCAFCETVSNTLLPLVPRLKEVQNEPPSNNLNFDTWLHNNMILIEDLKKETNINTTCCNLCEEYKPNLGSDLTKMIKLYVNDNYELGINHKKHLSNDQSIPAAFKSLSYNLRCIEAVLRNAKKPLLGELSSRQSLCIEAQIGIARVLGRDLFSKHAIKFHTILRIFEQISTTPSIFQMDLLSVVIYLTFSLPTIYITHSRIPIPTGDTLDYYILRFVFIIHIVQILSTMDINLLINGSSNIEKAVYCDILDVLKLMSTKYEEGLLGDIVWKFVQKASLPFLRCCILFYHHFSCVIAESSLYELEGDTFTNMCTYLDLPQTPKELLGSSQIINFVKVWCNHKYLHTQTIPPLTHPQNLLINLPKCYSELLNISSFFCSYCKKSSKTPTMCLLCEEILCCDNYCVMNNRHEDACERHTLSCSAGVGIFLSIKQCHVIYVHTSLGTCCVEAPYIDAYGSTDQGLLRGNPLTLCSKRYKKLEMIWLSHGICEEVNRALRRTNRILE